MRDPLRPKIYLITVVIMLSTCMSCATTKSPLVVRAKQDVTVTLDSGEQRTISKGEPISFEARPIIVESPGYMSAVIVPSPSSGQLELNLKDLNDWGGPQLDKRINTVVNHVVSEILEAQKLMSQKKFSEALERIKTLTAAHPDVTYLGFLEASALVGLGRSSDASIALNRALEEFPDNPSGVALKKIIDAPSEANTAH